MEVRQKCFCGEETKLEADFERALQVLSPHSISGRLTKILASWSVIWKKILCGPRVEYVFGLLGVWVSVGGFKYEGVPQWLSVWLQYYPTMYSGKHCCIFYYLESEVGVINNRRSVGNVRARVVVYNENKAP